VEHIWTLIGLASVCHDTEELRMRRAAKYGKQPFQLMMFVDPPKDDDRPRHCQPPRLLQLHFRVMHDRFSSSEPGWWIASDGRTVALI
jgi:hypothetical protein